MSRSGLAVPAADVKTPDRRANEVRTFHGLNALSSSSPFIANATDGKCCEMTDFIEFRSTQSMPCLV